MYYVISIKASDLLQQRYNIEPICITSICCTLFFYNFVLYNNYLGMLLELMYLLFQNMGR